MGSAALSALPGGRGLLPFVHTKKTGEEFKNNFEPASFYSETESADRARVVETSMDALESRVLMIHQAEKRIVLSTFDIRDGSSCRDIFSSLLEAADRGVKVQILVDGLYGTFICRETRSSTRQGPIRTLR